MELPKIKNVGVYRDPEKWTQTVTDVWLGLYVRGKIRSTSYYPDGTLCSISENMAERPPQLTISTPGFRTSFEYGSNRENWVVMLDFPALSFDDAEHQMYWNYEGKLLPLPRVILLQEDVSVYQDRFQTLARLYQSSLPQNQLKAELMVLELLYEFLQIPEKKDDIVEIFRKQLEADRLWKFSIGEHCRQLKVNRDLLRKEFMRRYQISPGEFRTRMRLRKIRHLLAYSNLSLKEISYEIGMKNLSHLSRFIREQCGCTPSELRKKNH